MKRAMTGGARRGPVAHARQVRTLRFMQVVLALVGVGLLVLAGAELARGRGNRDALAPREGTSLGKAAALVLLAATAFGGAAVLQERGGVRLPTPARLEELAERAEELARAKAEEAARASPSGDVRSHSAP
jgi:hypothetical protein